MIDAAGWVSGCCGSYMLIRGRTTKWYECGGCGQPCDPVREDGGGGGDGLNQSPQGDEGTLNMSSPHVPDPDVVEWRQQLRREAYGRE